MLSFGKIILIKHFVFKNYKLVNYLHFRCHIDLLDTKSR